MLRRSFSDKEMLLQQITLSLFLFIAMWELDYLEQCGTNNTNFKEVTCIF